MFWAVDKDVNMPRVPKRISEALVSHYGFFRLVIVLDSSGHRRLTKEQAPTDSRSQHFVGAGTKRKQNVAMMTRNQSKASLAEIPDDAYTYPPEYK